MADLQSAALATWLPSLMTRNVCDHWIYVNRTRSIGRRGGRCGKNPTAHLVGKGSCWRTSAVGTDLMAVEKLFEDSIPVGRFLLMGRLLHPLPESKNGCSRNSHSGHTQMGLKQFLLKRLFAKRLKRLAAIVSQRSHEEVWEMVCDRCTSMSLAEARGYIRSRSASVVRAELNRMVFEYKVSGHRELSASALDQLYSLSIDRLMKLVLSSLLNQKSERKPIRKAA